MTGRGNVRNFDGVCMQLTGNCQKLGEVEDALEYVAGVIVTGARDIEGSPGNGILFLQCRKHSQPIVLALAKKHGLEVGC